MEPVDRAFAFSDEVSNEDVSDVQVCSGPIYGDAPIPEGVTVLDVFLVNVTVRWKDGSYTLMPVSIFYPTFKAAEDEWKRQSEHFPQAAIHGVRLWFRNDDPGQMAELAEYREQFASERGGLQ